MTVKSEVILFRRTINVCVNFFWHYQGKRIPYKINNKLSKSKQRARVKIVEITLEYDKTTFIDYVVYVDDEKFPGTAFRGRIGADGWLYLESDVGWGEVEEGKYDR